ncbi:ParB N-terminal domain-containing protein [Brucella pituitosa]|uniref:ParB N-terminal domain-containing protein n=1 Tax=Brucella pituitosa TaxID=571256 RepID=UPI003F4AF67F
MNEHINIVANDIWQQSATRIKLSEIEIPDSRARELDPDWAQALAFMIDAHGLINPITVRIVDGVPRLVTGFHRYTAFSLLGWEAIPVRISTAATDDEARLEEVMENLGRHELKVLDRCHHLFELKQVHERLYPETRHGGDRRSDKIKSQDLAVDPDAPEILGFSKLTAEKTGFSQSAIKLAVKIWKELSVASRQRCVGTWLADHQAGLKQLSEQSHTDQSKVLDILFGDQPKATNVPDALTILANGRVKTHLEKKIEKAGNTLRSLPSDVAGALVASDARLADLQEGIAMLSKYFSKLEDAELDSVVAEHEDRIIASLQRRGRI